MQMFQWSLNVSGKAYVVLHLNLPLFTYVSRSAPGSFLCRCLMDSYLHSCQRSMAHNSSLFRLILQSLMCHLPHSVCMSLAVLPLPCCCFCFSAACPTVCASLVSLPCVPALCPYRVCKPCVQIEQMEEPSCSISCFQLPLPPPSSLLHIPSLGC